MLIPRLAILFAIPSTVFASGKGCRSCTCEVTLRVWDHWHDQEEVTKVTHQWVRQFVSGGDFEQFNMTAHKDASCKDGGKRCDRWFALFDAYRLCANGGVYYCSVGNSNEWPRYEVSCDTCKSVHCHGDCTTDCSYQPLL